MSFGDILAIKNRADLADILHKISCDFLISSNAYRDFITSAINSGTLSGAAAATPEHPGVIEMYSSTTPNSGYRVITFAGALLLGGGEKTTIIFKTPNVLTDITIRMGFLDNADINPPVDGVYAKILNGILTGNAVNNSALSTTPTNYTLTPATWYRLIIELNSNATLTTYKLYADNSDTVLWSDTLSTNIPKDSGRWTGYGVIATNAGTSAVLVLQLDYIDILLPKSRRV